MRKLLNSEVRDTFYNELTSFRGRQKKMLKIIVLGEQGTGKSSLTLCEVAGSFFADIDPTLEDSYTKSIYITEHKSIVLNILDTVKSICLS